MRDNHNVGLAMVGARGDVKCACRGFRYGSGFGIDSRRVINGSDYEVV